MTKDRRLADLEAARALALSRNSENVILSPQGETFAEVVQKIEDPSSARAVLGKASLEDYIRFAAARIRAGDPIELDDHDFTGTRVALRSGDVYMVPSYAKPVIVPSGLEVRSRPFPALELYTGSRAPAVHVDLLMADGPARRTPVVVYADVREALAKMDDQTISSRLIEAMEEAMEAKELAELAKPWWLE
jgi:hypothetical protein